jgi:hypothetical protein
VVQLAATDLLQFIERDALNALKQIRRLIEGQLVRVGRAPALLLTDAPAQSAHFRRVDPRFTELQIA